MTSAGDIYARQGIGGSLGFGERAALLLIDFVNGFNDPDILGGGNIPDAIAHSVSLLGAARQAGIPIAHTRIVYEADGVDIGTFATKLPGLQQLHEDAACSQVVDDLKPHPGEYVVRKKQASAFFDTDLSAWLRQKRVDTLLIGGCTTSGCVRASVVDAASLNFIPIVVRECVGDRALEPHIANMFDMEQKYADVQNLAHCIRWLKDLKYKD